MKYCPSESRIFDRDFKTDCRQTVVNLLFPSVGEINF